MSAIIEMCHERELPANTIQPQAEMDLLRTRNDAGATTLRTCTAIARGTDTPDATCSR